MALSIDPQTFVIFVPIDYLTLVQSSPTWIYELDLNNFRLDLKDIEDDEQGIYLTKTHNHNTEVQLGGITYARVIEILPPYTITFEPSAYAVNLVGANSNVGDRVNVNQVSVRSNNSSGLISSPAIEYSSFGGGVTIDIVNGVAGTIYPRGTIETPVNNLADAKLIADFRGFDTFFINKSMEIGNGIDLSDFTFVGKSHVKTIITMDSSPILNDITIENCNITGILDGGTHINRCSVGDITYVNGHIHDSGLYGTIVLGGNDEAVIANCFTLDQDSPPIIDMGWNGQDLAMPNYSGIVTINNLNSDTEEIGVGLNAGMVILSETVSAGTIIISGTGLLMDNTTGTANVNSQGLINNSTIANSVLSRQVSGYGENSLGKTISSIKKETTLIPGLI